MVAVHCVGVIHRLKIGLIYWHMSGNDVDTEPAHKSPFFGGTMSYAGHRAASTGLGVRPESCQILNVHHTLTCYYVARFHS